MSVTVQEFLENITVTVDETTQNITVSADVVTVNETDIFPARTVTANYTATANDNTIFVNSASAIVITIPSGIIGKPYIIKNIGIGIVTVSGQTIEGQSSISLNQFDALSIKSDGTNYWII